MLTPRLVSVILPFAMSSCGSASGSACGSACGSGHAWQPVLSAGSFSMGGASHVVPMRLHQANRARLVNALKATLRKPVEENPSAASDASGVVLLQGGSEVPHYDADTSYQFVQESNFMWLFGCAKEDCFGAVDIKSGKSVLFVPRLPEDYATWMGKIFSPAELQAHYAVDEVRFVDELECVLRSFSQTLYVIHGLNTDSKNYAQPATFRGIENFTVDKTLLYPIVCELRVFKTEDELAVLRYVIAVSSRAHVQVMKSVRPGMYEYQAEAEFLHHSYAEGGCRFTGYQCICCTGHSGASLHYNTNQMPLKDGDMCLFDMGAQYHGYVADITCSFPANGVFTADQRAIYEAVLAANRAVLAAMRPGVLWTDMHVLSARVLCEHLVRIGILQGDVDELMRAEIIYMLYPHGLGHLLGLNVHDVGGYPLGVARPTGLGISKLRTARALEAGMVITVEPGLYFIDHYLDAALGDPAKARFFNAAVLARFRGFGGVRIEDDVLVTEGGVELLSILPRTVEEIEAVMAASK